MGRERESAASWISPRFETGRSNEFLVGGIPIEDIAEKYEPPFYIYDWDIIEDQYRWLQQATDPNGIDIYYSMKANPAVSIIARLRAMGAGMEVASGGEIDIAKYVRIPSRDISYAGPVKSIESLESAIDYGVGIINIERENQFTRISEFAAKNGTHQKVGIRVNPTTKVTDAGSNMGEGKFGIDEEVLTKDYIEWILSLPGIDLAGIHVYSASQMLNPKIFLNNFENTCRISEDLNKIFPVRVINFGGGLGIPYSRDQNELPIPEISDGMKRILQKFPFIERNEAALHIEPGRYLVGQSGIYVSRVDSIKTSNGRGIVTIEGGINHMMRPAPAFGFGEHPTYNLSYFGDKELFDVAGEICSPIDYLATNVLLSKPQEGDLIGIFNAGAYGLTQSPVNFLHFPIPSELIVSNGQVTKLNYPVGR